MTPRMYAGGVAALCVSIVVSASLVAQDKPAEYQLTPEEQQWADAMAAFRTPGEPHARLAAREGSWNVAGRMWYGADEPAQGFSATSRIKAILGGRFILEKIEGNLLGEAFEGVGIFGYDNLTQSYVGVWIDNFGTGIGRFESTSSDDDGIQWLGEQPNVMTGSYEKIRSVGLDISENEHVLTSYGPAPDGSGEIRQMELRYIRSGNGY